MSEKIVQLNEEVIKGQIKEQVRGSVEETLNELLEAEAEKLTQAARYERNEQRCKNRHPSPICTRFEHHFHVLKPHLHRRSFSDTLPENQRHLIALKRHPLWHMQKLCQLSQPAELRSTFFRNRNAVLCQDVLQLSNPLALSLEFFLSCVKVFHRLTLHLVVAGPFQF